MKIRLESFEQIFILSVRETVSVNDARIVIAGLAKLMALGKKWVIVDLSHSMFAEVAIQKFDEAVNALRFNAKNEVKTYFVGLFPTFCEFEDLSDALEKSKVKDFREIALKFELEDNRENLKRLISAREKVSEEVYGKGKSIEQIQTHFIRLNRNLRAAQTSLINRLLDPVFSDLWCEPAAEPMEILNWAKKIGAVLRTETGDVDVHSKASNPYRYESKKMDAYLRDLRSEISDLQSNLKHPFQEGKADRCVSLLMENSAIRERITEIQNAWIQKLTEDNLTTREDFDTGFSALIEKQEAS